MELPRTPTQLGCTQLCMRERREEDHISSRADDSGHSACLCPKARRGWESEVSSAGLGSEGVSQCEHPTPGAAQNTYFVMSPKCKSTISSDAPRNSVYSNTRKTKSVVPILTYSVGHKGVFQTLI